MSRDGLIYLENVSKVDGSGTARVDAISEINLEIAGGEFIAIIGPSGSGKSTLMNIIGCLDRPSAGRYILDGEDVSHIEDEKLARIRNKKIGFVFQMFNLLAKHNALYSVQLPLVYAGAGPEERREKGIQMLKKMGLEGRITHRPNQLSGGECQRVAIARALINDPPILLTDEPTGNLDTRTGDEIISLFRKLNSDEGVTLIMVTHNPEIAAKAKRSIFIRDGRIVEGVVKETI